MDIPAVLAGDGRRAREVQAALAARRVVDGHAAGLSGRELIAYAAAGIRSDHESTTVEEARAKAAPRDAGPGPRGLERPEPRRSTAPAGRGELDDSWCLVTDDIFPNDLRRHGHLDGLLRRVVAGGVSPAVAVRHASYVPARHYGLVDRGAIAPGYRADLVLVEDLEDFRVRTVIKDGGLAARDGRCLHGSSDQRLDRENTVHLAPLDEGTFHLRHPVISRAARHPGITNHHARGLRRTGAAIRRVVKPDASYHVQAPLPPIRRGELDGKSAPNIPGRSDSVNLALEDVGMED